MMKRLWFERPAALVALKPGAHGVIEASAGTGKTFTIEHLIVDLLRRGGEGSSLRLEEILVVTYTNAATADLKKKIRQRLSELVEAWQEIQGEDGEDFALREGRISRLEGAPKEESRGEWVYLDEESSARLRRGLRNFDQAAIYTIHGFCQRVLTEHAFASGRLFEQEHRSEEEVFEEATGHFLREEAALNPELREWLQVYLAGGHQISDLEEMLRVYGQGRREIAPRFEPERFKECVAELLELGGDPREVERWAADLKEAGVGTRSVNTAKNKHFPAIVEALAAVPEGSEAGLLMAALAAKDARKYFTKGKGGLQILEAQTPLSELLSEFFELSHSFEAAMGAIFGARIQKRVQALKEREGYFTYQDMLEMVAETLKKPGGSVLASLRERFRFGIIDEFQDTDELQWEIFRRIFVESPRKDRHFLYVVGDPKQSIYGFRGGDVFTYIDARDELIGQEKPVFLTHNYRSTPEVIQAYNGIFDGAEGVSSPIDLGEGIVYARPVACGKPRFCCRIGGPEGEKAPALQVVEIVGESSEIDAVREGVARAYAEMIRDLLEHPKGYWIGEEGAEKSRWERLGAEHIFVLCRKLIDSRRVARELRRVGVPFAFLKMDGLFQTREAREIYELLVALADPSSRSARARAWMTAFFDLSLKDLEGIGEIGEESPIFQRLLRWSAMGSRGRYRELFAEMVGESGLLRRQLLFAQSERELTNYLHILEVIAEEAESRRMEIGELAMRLKGFIDGRLRPEGADGDQQRLEVEEQAVNILTAHSSKGLQRGVVFYMPAFSSIRSTGELRVTVKENGERRKVTWVAGLSQMPPEMEAQYLQQARAEEHRLNYVAMTRPEAMFVVPFLGPEHGKYSPPDPGPSKRIPYLDICDRLAALRQEESFQALSAWTVFDTDQIDDAGPDGEEIRKGIEEFGPILEASIAPEQEEEERLRDEGRREALRQRRWEITSYSKLKGLGGELENTPELARAGFDDPLEGAAGVSVGELPGGMDTGNFLHKVLEDLDYEEIGVHLSLESFQGDQELVEFFQRRARQFGIAEEYLPAAMKVIYDALRTSIPLPESPLTPIPGLFTVEEVLKEMEFLFPIPQQVVSKEGNGELQRRFQGLDEVRSGFVTGVVDLVFGHGGKVYFGDWKSDVCRDYGLASLRAKVEERYANQANLYTLALCRVLGIESRKAYEERFGGLFYFFLRGMRPGNADGVYYERIDWADLMDYESWLAGFHEAPALGGRG